MPRIILMFNKQVIQEFPFSEQSMTIGRKAENHIIIDNLSVSGFHARMDVAGNDFILTDLQSTNGTFVNDKKIGSCKLKHGDNVIIGKHVLLFLDSDGEHAEDEPVTDEEIIDLDRTMMLDTVQQRELLSKQQASMVSPSGVPEKIGILSFLTGSDSGEIQLIKKLTRIGRSNNSEVKLTGLFMGATAATISRRPSNYTITFTGGMTKLKVNGEVVKTSAPLKDFDTIELGSHKFQFYQRDDKGAC
jgi:pSer/pThr/pTyr-binding forkhead associated (FHA) protein